MNTRVKKASEIMEGDGTLPTGWICKVIVSGDNLTYFLAHEASKEALVLDPVREDWKIILEQVRFFSGYRFLAVIDTHTHADHVSCAGQLAHELKIPLVMHERSPSRRPHLRVCHDVRFPSAAAPLLFLTTPGHTEDGITPIWGPWIFSGDTILFGDTGRDDLPGGNPEKHFDSLQKIKAHVRPEFIFLPGHDSKGGRISTWAHQLKISPSLTQDREAFVAEASAFVAPAPQFFKESLFENFK